jgi:hypothetical protein
MRCRTSLAISSSAIRRASSRIALASSCGVATVGTSPETAPSDVPTMLVTEMVKVFEDAAA